MEDWTILVVGEEAADRAALEKCLLRDYRVIAVASVKDALHVLEEEEIDVIVSDLHMSDAATAAVISCGRLREPN